MNFDALVARLAAERRPSWQVYRSAPGRTIGGHLDQCRDAWNLWFDVGSWWIIRGWGVRRTEEQFPSEAAACDVLYARVVETGEQGVRALALDELPEPAQRLARLTRTNPQYQRTGDVLALGGVAPMGLRVVDTTHGIRVDRPSVVPPTVGDTWFTGLTLDEASRVVMLEAADRLPRRPGLPRWGIPSHERERAAAALKLWADLSLDRLEAAFLGAPEGVLEVIAPASAVDLLTEGLLVLAEAQGYRLTTEGGEDAVVLGEPSDPSFALRRTVGGFAVERRGERSNSWKVHREYATLAEARAELVALLGPVRLPRSPSSTVG